MRPHEVKNILKVGAFLSILLGILMIFVVFIGKENALFSSKVDVRGRSESAQNLKVGAFVQLKGIKVGQVSYVNIISQEEIEVVATINAEYIKWIKQDSTMEINSAGLVGDKFLEIKGGSESSPPVTEQSILKISPPVSIDQYLGKGDAIIKSASELLDRLNRLLAVFETNDNFEKLMADVTKTANNMQKVSQAIAHSDISKTFKNLDHTSQRLSNIMDQVEQGPGSAHSFLYDDILHEKVINLLGGAERNKVLKYFIRKSIKDSEKTLQ